MQEKICPVCGKGRLHQVNDIISELSGYIFVEKGERCDKCHEEFPYREETQETITAARKLGVWPEPLKLYRKLSKSGRGIVLRIPTDLERQMKLKGTEEVTITKIGSRIVVEISKEK